MGLCLEVLAWKKQPLRRGLPAERQFLFSWGMLGREAFAAERQSFPFACLDPFHQLSSFPFTLSADSATLEVTLTMSDDKVDQIG